MSQHSKKSLDLSSFTHSAVHLLIEYLHVELISITT